MTSDDLCTDIHETFKNFRMHMKDEFEANTSRLDNHETRLKRLEKPRSG